MNLFDSICPREKKDEFYCNQKSNWFWVLWVGSPALIIFIFFIAILIYWKKR